MVQATKEKDKLEGLSPNQDNTDSVLSVAEDKLISIKDGLIELSAYIDSTDECIGELFEIKNSIEHELERNNVMKDLAPCFNYKMERFSNFLTLIEMSHNTLKKAFSKTNAIADTIKID